MYERRRYVRIIESLKITYKVVEPPDGTGKCSTEDIGGGGIRFSVKDKVSVGDIVDLEISIPDTSNSIKTVGQVMWVNKTGHFNFQYMMGVKFIKIHPFDRGKLLNYIRKLIRDKKIDDIGWLK
jgi:c-di-GMP-binding flagellar brake protein YcgR